MKNIKLLDSNQIPILGFGTYKLGENEVSDALDTGYRHIDTAEHYANEYEIGRAIKNTELDRKEIFITSKVWRSNLAYKNVISSCKNSLSELHTDYIDLYLIHWPNHSIPLEETVKALTKLKSDGLIKSIGVSNFSKGDIDYVMELTDEIVVNQIELHPSYFQTELVEYCQSKDIAVTAYSPLGIGRDLSIPKIEKIAEKHNSSAAQVILAWHRAKNIIAIPKASSRKNMEDNFKSLDLELDSEDIQEIDTLNSEDSIF